MEPTIAEFIMLLFPFRPQTTCFAADAYGVSPQLITEDVFKQHCFFSLNPLHTHRKDSNCTSFNNFLIEFDEAPLDAQIALTDSSLPYTAAVYSGSKSIHFTLHITDAPHDIASYKAIAKAILKAVEAKYHMKPDYTTTNPSRLTRSPEAYRSDKTAIQSLVALGKQYTLQQVEDVLHFSNFLQPFHPRKTKQIYTCLQDQVAAIPPYIAKVITGQVVLTEGSRNTRFWSIAKQLKDLGFEADVVYDLLATPATNCDFPLRELEQVIYSAYRS